MRNAIVFFALVSALFMISIAFAGTIQLPETGQTSCYDFSGTAISCSSTGQDGALVMGVAWTSPRFSDNGDQTLSDNLTGLVWSKSANPATTTRTWQGALNYIKTLNAANYLGYNDWQLPNRKELMSLVNRGQANSATWLNSQGFTGVQSSSYWSSSSDASSPTGAWVVGMNVGDVSSSSKTSSSYIWPVRAGQPWIFGPFDASITAGMYPSVALGNNSRATYTITNKASTFHPLTQATITGANAADFTITNDTCSNQTIFAGNACTLDVIFTPSAAGSRTASLHMASGTDTAAISLSRTGSTDIRGTVTDLSTGLPLSGATVALSGGGSIATAADGTFTFTPAYGTFNNVTVSKTGYNSYTVNNITTSATQGAQLKLGMAPTGLLNITTPAPLVPTSTFVDTIKVTGGTGPYTFSLAYGNLPTGLTLDPALGTITGTPATSGSHIFAVGVTDSLGAYAEREYTVNFPIITSAGYLPRATQNLAYSTTIVSQGGFAPVTFSSTTLPSGLTLNNSTGVVSGTPALIGPYGFDVTVIDSVGRSYKKNFRMFVEAPLAIATSSLAGVVIDSAYSQTVLASGGFPPYSWNITSGTLPQGITIDSVSGIISGTTPYCGSFPVAIQAVDSATPATTASAGYTLNIACAPGYSVTGSISINNGDANTISSAVNLAIAVANNVLARQMRFSTDNATWGSWETYATSKNYNLAAGFGTKYVYVQIKDAADNVATFVDDIYLRTFYPLTLAFAGTGGGSVNGGMSCVKGEGCPPQSFEESTQVTLTPSADSNSTFTSWSAACVISGINCVVTMNSAKTATATFTEADKVRIGAVPYTTMGAAFAKANTGDIKARSIEFAETFNVTLPTVFKGGWNSTFDGNSGTFTTLNGTLTIGTGSLTVEGLAIR